MRLRHPDGSVLHLAYCSNVHPADDLDGVAAQLERYAARVRERLDAPVLGVGLWVAAPALSDAAAAERLRAQLDRLGLEVVTLNGFPYTRVPRRRREARRLPPELGRRRSGATTRSRSRACSPRCCPTTSPRARSRRFRSAGAPSGTRPTRRRDGVALQQVAVGLAEIEAATGKTIRLALEPEPGCTIETVDAGVRVPGRARARVDRPVPGRVPSRRAVRAARTARWSSSRPPACPS